MLKLSSLRPYKNATQRRKVVGRGVGSGHGTFSGKGAKGQKARSGGKIPVGFEGGNMPLQRQMPKKRGFKSLAAKAQPVTLTDISAKFQTNETVNPKTLVNKGLVRSAFDPIKILSTGDVTKSYTFEKVDISAQALEKIKAAGGKVAETKPATKQA